MKLIYKLPAYVYNKLSERSTLKKLMKEQAI